MRFDRGEDDVDESFEDILACTWMLYTRCELVYEPVTAGLIPMRLKRKECGSKRAICKISEIFANIFRYMSVKRDVSTIYDGQKCEKLDNR